MRLHRSNDSCISLWNSLDWHQSCSVDAYLFWLLAHTVQNFNLYPNCSLPEPFWLAASAAPLATSMSSWCGQIGFWERKEKAQLFLRRMFQCLKVNCWHVSLAVPLPNSIMQRVEQRGRRMDRIRYVKLRIKCLSTLKFRQLQ